MESPLQEAQEHIPGGYEQGEEGSEGEGDIEQLLSQLSPEELQQLAEELSSEMQSPEAQQSGEDVEGLAQAIQENLAQNPEASPEGIPAEKAAALDFVKSASYIEGFLHEALDNGANLKQAVDLYDTALSNIINEAKTQKTASIPPNTRRTFFSKARKAVGEQFSKGKEKVMDAVTRGATRLEDFASDASKKYEKFKTENPNAIKNLKRVGVAGGVVATGIAGKKVYDAATKKEDEQEKTSAYCEGLMEQALYNGFTPKQAEYLAATAYEDLQKHAQLTTQTFDVLNHFLLENIN
jgi:hypothetical protein